MQTKRDNKTPIAMNRRVIVHTINWISVASHAIRRMLVRDA